MRGIVSYKSPTCFVKLICSYVAASPINLLIVNKAHKTLVILEVFLCL